jgi:hypothetical protein
MFGSPDLGPMTRIETDGEPNSSVERVLRWAWRTGLVVLALLVLALAWLAAYGEIYKSGDDVGYNMGLVGGLLMLSLLLYPLRKRVRWLDRLGSMLYWFRYHMVVGIGAPVLILFHSTFKTGSMNGAVALYAMLLVATSGVVGRFLYRHIHRGMYGQQLSMADAENALKGSTEAMREIFHDFPEIEQRLVKFREYAFADLGGTWPRIRRFVTLHIRGRRLSRSVREQLKRAMKKAKREQLLNRNQRILTYRLAKEKANAYVDAVCEASQLTSWERLFSLWHVIHIPFLYLLVVSGIVHVIAVHMY